MVVEGGGSVIQLEGHDLSVDDMMGGIAVRNVDPRVLADGLGQSLFEPLIEGAAMSSIRVFLAFSNSSMAASP